MSDESADITSLGRTTLRDLDKALADARHQLREERVLRQLAETKLRAIIDDERVPNWIRAIALQGPPLGWGEVRSSPAPTPATAAAKPDEA